MFLGAENQILSAKKSYSARVKTSIYFYRTQGMLSGVIYSTKSEHIFQTHGKIKFRLGEFAELVSRLVILIVTNVNIFLQEREGMSGGVVFS